jgi:hypothetical protein
LLLKLERGAEFWLNVDVNFRKTAFERNFDVDIWRTA